MEQWPAKGAVAIDQSLYEPGLDERRQVWLNTPEKA